MSINKKKAFTLIEMLIVVVIIGILAAALIPRLQGVQGRARDTQRKTDLGQIGNGAAIYKSDYNGSYSGAVSNGVISAGLAPAYMTSVPTEKITSRSALTEITGAQTGQYAGAHFVNGTILILGANTEVAGTSNAVKATSLNPGDMPTAQSYISSGSVPTNTPDASLRYYYVQ